MRVWVFDTSLCEELVGLGSSSARNTFVAQSRRDLGSKLRVSWRGVDFTVYEKKSSHDGKQDRRKVFLKY